MGRPGFGTDGLRGVANVELTAELATALGRAAVSVLGAPAFVVGRDTRQSSPMLQAALSAGMAAEGADVVDLGVVPTAGVAFVAERRGVPAAMVSASHNPYTDNGIKLFDAGGVKLAPEVESEVEAAMDGPPGTGRVGSMVAAPEGSRSYADHLVHSLDGRRLDALHVAVDCANGAASSIFPAVLERLGARVDAVCAEPDGTNINSGCGSTAPQRLAGTVVETGADLGLAVDGDADRLVAVDHTGAVLDGDVLLALFALDLRAHGQLAGDAVVVTVMTNLGFRLAMERRGIAVHETPVGDRQVLAAIDAGGFVLGGEQSGHIVFRRRASTGDGLLTGILLADLVARSGGTLAAAAAGLVERVPQVLVNVAVPDPSRLGDAAEIWEAATQAEAELAGRGRVLLRPSGTEPLVRVMVEAADHDVAVEIAARLSKVVESALVAGGNGPPPAGAPAAGHESGQ